MERFRKKWEDYLSRYWQYLDVTFVGCVQTLVVQQTIRAYVRYKHNWRKFISAILNATVYSSSYTLHSSAISVSLISFRLTTPSQIQWSVVHHKHRVNLLILSNSFMRNKKCHLNKTPHPARKHHWTLRSGIHMFVVKPALVVFSHVYEERKGFFLNNWNRLEVARNGLKYVNIVFIARCRH